MSADRGIQQGAAGAGGRGIGVAAGRIGRGRDDGRLSCDPGSGARVILVGPTFDDCTTDWQFGKSDMV
jgi:hypothetical protein